MNLGEAMTHVLRTKGQSIIQSFWKEDLLSLISDVITEGVKLFQDSKSRLRSLTIKELPGNIFASAREILEIARIMPERIRRALEVFREEMIHELEERPDASEKALFSLKILGVLFSSTASAFYNMRNTGKELSLGKLRVRSALAQFLVAEIVLRSFRLFLKRFLHELEKELTEKADVDQVRYFRRLLDTGEVAENTAPADDDPVFRIVDRIKNIVLTGDDEGQK
ncbi:MAG: hypothetical protein ACJ76H_15605 [Bacteriovoracaceae bacterium]